MNPKIKKIRALLEKRIHHFSPEPVLSSEQFPWAKEIESHSPVIRQEALNVLERLDEVINFNDVLPHQRALTQDDKWKSFFLVCGNEVVPNHERLCPETVKAVQKIPGVVNAFYSILRPGVEIPPHRGPYAGLLRYHLGLVIPKGDTAIRVGHQVCQWKEGESLFFDDSFDHEAWNRTDSMRVILFVDFVRPLPMVLGALNYLLIKMFLFTKEAKLGRQKILTTQISHLSY